MDKCVHKTLNDKVEDFVRKYYVNRLLHGLLLGAMLWLLLLLALNTLEYFSWLTPSGRFVLFLFLIIGSLAIGIFYLVIPLVNLIRFRKKMPNEKAAVMIGRFFPEIQDKLLNTLQLAGDPHSSENELLAAAIDQRTAALSPFRFTDAVDFKDNIKFAIPFFCLLIVALLLTIFVPRFAVQPTQRIINYNQYYERPLPFSVVLSDTVIELTQGDDTTFSIAVTGERIPDNFFVKGKFGQQLMRKNRDNSFDFVFRNVAEDISFNVVGGDYTSPPLALVVHPKPVLLSYSAALDYPEYTRIQDEKLEGRNHLIVPAGTRVSLTFLLRDADSCYIVRDSVTQLCDVANSSAKMSFTAAASEKIGVMIANRWGKGTETIFFHVDVTPDAYPDIKVEQYSEKLYSDLYYSGLLTDDYGFSKLTFNYTDPANGKTYSQPVAFDKSGTRSSFFYSVDADSLSIGGGKPMEAFFEVWDNDAFHGPKSKRSEVFVFTPPTSSTLDSAANATQNQVLSQMADKAKEAEQLRNEIDQLLRELVSKQELNWYDKEKIKNVLEKQNQLQEDWKALQEEQQSLSDFMKNNDLANEELRQKQEKINKLFEETVNDDLKKVMDEIEKLLEKLPRDRIQEMLRDLKTDNQQLNDLLDRNLSLLEQLKTEKEIYDLIDKLEKLAEELQNEQSDDKDANAAKDEFNKMMDELSKIEEHNKSLTDPFDLSRDEQLENDIKQDLNDASSSQQQGDNQQSQQQMNSAGQKMQEMANKLAMQMQMGGMQQMAEDARLVRELLDNTILASHRQEELMLEVGQLQKDDPQVSEKLVEQSDLLQNFNIVRDSLEAMALRQPIIQNFVFDELHNIETQTNLALRSMNELNLNAATGSQQRSLMAMNNLALMLSESLENMQNAMMSMGMPMQGSNGQQGNQPSQNMKGMTQKQQELGKKLKELQQQMQKEGGTNQSSMSEQLARMAAEQEMLRQGMQQMLDEMKQNGELGDGGLQKIIEDMKKLEEEIVNKKITPKTVKRNQDIISRMLESEKAMQEREKDQKRKSNEFKGTLNRRVVDPLEFERSMKRGEDYLKTQPIDYQPYYKDKINQYYLRKNQN